MESVLDLSAAEKPARKGLLLVVPRGGILPASCVKCGQTSPEQTLQTYNWVPSWLYLVLLAGMLIGVLPGLVLYYFVGRQVRQRFELVVPACQRHRRRQRRARVRLPWH